LVGADRVVPVASVAARLQVEILTLRHQLNVLRRKSPQRLRHFSADFIICTCEFEFQQAQAIIGEPDLDE
jgi:hypothetical protein